MGILTRIARSLGAKDEQKPLRRISRGETLHSALMTGLVRPSFEIGSSIISGYHESIPPEVVDATTTAMEYTESPTMIRMETAYRMLERIDDARQALRGHVGPASLRPVTATLSAMDWGRIKHLTDRYGDEGLHISLPFVLDGRWIGNDLEALLDLASTIVVDMSIQEKRPEDIARLDEAANRVGPVMAALYIADNDCGFHVNMPSPFGPPEIRRHDTTGYPFEAFGLPDTDAFKDLPDAYEASAHISGQNLRMEITRFRVFNNRYGINGEEGWRISDTLKSVMRFDPRPLPETNTHPTSRRDEYLLKRGRKILLVRRQGRDEFEFPGFVRPPYGEDHSAEYDRRMETMLSSLGVNRTSRKWEYVATGTYVDENVDVPYTNHELLQLRFEGEPQASDDITEIHWLDIDAPARPMTFVTEHLLLDQVRTRMDKGDLN